jgi:diguanylate cyclase (GGDEF)-like protein/PAS domain S-box-containing protein
MPPETTPTGAPGQGDLEVDAPDPGRPIYDPLLAFETILEQSQLNITIFDREYVIRDVSRSAAALARMTRDEMRGRSLLEALPPVYHGDLERTLAGESIDAQGKVPPGLCKDETWTHVTTLPIRDEHGVVRGGMVIVFDVSEQKRADELVEKLAVIDPITELPNRAMLSMMLAKALSGAKGKQRRLAAVWLNLDRFKDVNNALGRQAGDELLRAVGGRLQEAVRTFDVVARVGGDDFVLLLPRINSRQHLERLMGRIQDVFAAPFVVAGESVLLSASCGIAVHPDGGTDSQQLRESAHTAMRTAKELGGGAFEIYNQGVAEQSSARLWLAREIRAGIAQGHFVLYYQPQVDLKTMRVQAVEALARWNHPERGLLLPAEFISFAEESGLIVSLGRYLLAQACRQLKGWQESLESAPRLAFNVSAREVQRSDVRGEVERAAAAAGIAPSALEIEFTETAVLADPRRAAEVAAGLRAAGATVALDDFGTGYSALTHLRELPIDRIKIDRSFVGSCLKDRSASAILVAVTHLAHDLGMEVVAEGVETEAQLDFVRAVGCDAAQGYHLARPLAHAACTDYLLRAEQGPVI